MRSLIYMLNTSAENILANSVLPLSTIARRTGQVLKSGNNGVLLGVPGYYKVDATITCTAPTAGDVLITLQKNSVNIPGVLTSESVITADTEIHTLSLSGIVRVFPIDSIASLTLYNEGVAIDTTNITLSVEFLG